MPFKSDRQRKAMHAAAEGRSTIGIPQSVGEKFVQHGTLMDLAKKRRKRRGKARQAR